MNSAASALQTSNTPLVATLQREIDCSVDALMASLPEPEGLSADLRRGIIARYSAVLEGNFIYWMTAALLAVKSEEARSIIVENLTEEVRDCHPGMLRRFSIAAGAFPTDADALAISEELMKVRLFLGRLSGVKIVLMMAFFEGSIQRFMSYLADLAVRQGSSDMEYTDVHGVCDVAHTQGLFRALDSEMAVNPVAPGADLFEGVKLLQTLFMNIVHYEKTLNRKVMTAGYAV